MIENLLKVYCIFFIFYFWLCIILKIKWDIGIEKNCIGIYGIFGLLEDVCIF